MTDDAQRLIVLFDLPTGTRIERRDATRFRAFLKDDGFYMLQFSVYVRAARDTAAIQKHLARVALRLPPRGRVCALTLTGAQFDAMRRLSGPEATPTEKVSGQQLILL